MTFLNVSLDLVSSSSAGVLSHLPVQGPVGGGQVPSHEHDGLAGPDHVGCQHLLRLWTVVFFDSIHLRMSCHVLHKLVVHKQLEIVQRDLTIWRNSRRRLTLKCWNLSSKVGWNLLAPGSVFVVCPAQFFSDFSNVVIVILTLVIVLVIILLVILQQRTSFPSLQGWLHASLWLVHLCSKGNSCCSTSSPPLR